MSALRVINASPLLSLNTNRLLRKGPNYYGKAIGIKSGYTAATQHNLVAARQSIKDAR